MQKEFGFAPLFVIIPIVLIFGIGFGLYYVQNRTTESTQTEQTEIIKPSTTETQKGSTPQSIQSNTSGAPEISQPTPTPEPTIIPSPSPLLTPSTEPTATPSSIRIKENTDKDKCILLFETSYNLHGESENCM